LFALFSAWIRQGITGSPVQLPSAVATLLTEAYELQAATLQSDATQPVLIAIPAIVRLSFHSIPNQSY